jgi:threonine dehydrogenase-like Zn-dependent dehydrogenase
MCGSDLHQYRRPKSGGESIGGLPVNPNPVIGGHEPCGIVAAIGPEVRQGRVFDVASAISSSRRRRL